MRVRVHGLSLGTAAIIACQVIVGTEDTLGGSATNWGHSGSQLENVGLEIKLGQWETEGSTSEGKQSWSQTIAKKRKKEKTHFCAHLWGRFPTLIIIKQPASNYKKKLIKKKKIRSFVLKVGVLIFNLIFSGDGVQNLPGHPWNRPSRSEGGGGVGPSLVFLSNLIRLWLTLHLAPTVRLLGAQIDTWVFPCWMAPQPLFSGSGDGRGRAVVGGVEGRRAWHPDGRSNEVTLNAAWLGLQHWLHFDSEAQWY